MIETYRNNIFFHSFVADEIILGYIMMVGVAVLMASIVVHVHYRGKFPKPKLLVLMAQMKQRFVTNLSKKNTGDRPGNGDQDQDHVDEVIDGVKLASSLNVCFFWIFLIAVIVFGGHSYQRL